MNRYHARQLTRRERIARRIEQDDAQAVLFLALILAVLFAGAVSARPFV